MIKYCFNVFDRKTGEKKTQVICTTDDMLETLKALNKLGLVKGYILDDKYFDDKGVK